MSTERQKNSNVNNVDKKNTIGLEFGFQWFMGRHVAGFGHFGYIFVQTDSEHWNQPSVEWKTIISIGLGLSYYF